MGGVSQWETEAQGAVGEVLSECSAAVQGAVLMLTTELAGPTGLGHRPQQEKSIPTSDTSHKSKGPWATYTSE